MSDSQPFVATPKQVEFGKRYWSSEEENHVILAGGAIRSGKTQIAARMLVETALRFPSTYLVARLTYRELKDSTQKAMLHGDGPIAPLIPHQAMLGNSLATGYRASDEMVTLVNGATILFRSLDEPAKLLNLTLGGIMVDQIEELDSGDAGERLYDTLFGRLSDPSGPRKMIAVANPAALTHWVHRRLVDPKTRDPGSAYVHFSLADNAANLPEDYVARMYATERTRSHWFKTFVLGEWGAFEGAAYEEFSDLIHVCRPFEIPTGWERFQSMDHGQANPTCWLAWAVDHDGNIVVFDEYYDTGLVSKHASEVKARLPLWRGEDQKAWSVAYADPSIKASQGLTSKLGVPASVWTEYLEHGVDFLVLGNNDRAAGYTRLLELLHVEEDRIPPPFARIPPEFGKSPRLFVFSSCEETIRQIKSAPIEPDGVEAGEAVAAKWERAHGHAHAALRYGALSWPDPTPIRPKISDDPRRALLDVLDKGDVRRPSPYIRV